VLSNRWARTGSHSVASYSLWLLQLLSWCHRNPGAEFQLPGDREEREADLFGGANFLYWLEQDFRRRWQEDEDRKRERRADHSVGCNGLFGGDPGI